MVCTICKRPARAREGFWSLSWKFVDQAEYKKRIQDGRSTKISEVCPDCMIQYKDTPIKGLRELNSERNGAL